MLESKEINRNSLPSFVFRISHHFATPVLALMCLWAERPRGEMSTCWGPGTWPGAGCRGAWVSSLTAHTPNRALFESDVVFKYNDTLLPSPLEEVEIKV